MTFMEMTAKSFLKAVGVAFLTVVAVFYLTAVALTVWNLMAPSEYCWMDMESIKGAAWALLALPALTAGLITFMDIR